MSSATLPRELWLQIFPYLSAGSLRTVVQVHFPNLSAKSSGPCLAESQLLQLKIELEEGGLKLLSTSTPRDETLRLIRSSRRAWQTLSLSRLPTIDVPFRAGRRYELTGGCFFLQFETGSEKLREFAYVRLPDVHDEPTQGPPSWTRIRCNADMSDFGVDVDQDLLCLVEDVNAQPLPQGGSNLTFRVHFRQMSDGTAHPGAREAAVEHIVEARFPFRCLCARIEFVANHVVILFRDAESKSLKTLTVWDWTTGQLKGTLGESEPKAIAAFSMLSRCHILLALLDVDHLEVYRFDSSSAQPPLPIVHEASFELPSGFTYTAPTPRLPSSRQRPTAFLGASGIVPSSAWRHLTRWDALNDNLCVLSVGYCMGMRHMVGNGDPTGESIPFSQLAPIRVQDFNPSLLRTVRSGNLHASDDVEIRICEAGTTSIIPGRLGAAAGLVLPCVEITTKQLYAFLAVVLDEDRVVGLSANEITEITGLPCFLMEAREPKA
ncbi:hypothetical protein EXIGLDRAFT_834574 [Exidia glandulosa HHB12029]|uniref:F-box domain-containing protein n=1 Tax=Exidia glandulosa HHB12029 TaxID=1314781 RepID=A0A165JL31_EXIGL|nr:hypothetical protein EXIGLDRAFT_834574 [Exidia glandulosa HHB12029]